VDLINKKIAYIPKSIILVSGLASHPLYTWWRPKQVTRQRTQVFDFFLDSWGSHPDPRSALDNLGIIQPKQLDNTYPPTSVTPDHGPHGCFWPRDLLPHHFPQARVCTYAYESRWTSTEYSTTIEECTREMLRQLMEFRTSESVREEANFCVTVCEADAQRTRHGSDPSYLLDIVSEV
jgi:hypothetical protein